MDDSVKAILHVLVSIGFAVLIFFAWTSSRPHDPMSVKIGASVIGFILSILFLHFATKG